MAQIIYNVTLRGTQDGILTTLKFDLGDFDPVVWVDVANAYDQIRGALVDITDAFIVKETTTVLISEDNQVPADANVTDELVIAVHLNAPDEGQKLATLRVPAPIDAVWEQGGVVLDKTNALVQQFVQQVSQHAFVSDGEQVNTNSGTAGINRGYFRSRPKKATGT